VNIADTRKRSYSLTNNFHPLRWIRSHTKPKKNSRRTTISSDPQPLTTLKEQPFRVGRSVTISDPLAPTPKPTMTFFY
ncbi:unnamed protein product, partial [Didymodactylos carnosus]